MILFDKQKYRKDDSHKIQQESYNVVHKSWDADWPHRYTDSWQQSSIGGTINRYLESFELFATCGWVSSKSFETDE